MASKTICLFILGMLHAEYAIADSDDGTKFDKAMSKAFMPMAQAKPSVLNPATQNPAVTPVSDAMPMADLEARTQEMKVEYQRLQARIEKLSQTDVESSVGLSAPFHWFVGLVASIGLAASVGVAGVRKYTAQNQQGSESRTVSQISLPLVPQAPQRARPIVAVEAAFNPEKPWKPWKLPVKESTGLNPVDPTQKKRDDVALDELKSLAKDLNPVIGYFDPLGLSRQDYWDQGAAAQIAFLRHAEIKHGRVAMAGFIGFMVHENHIHWPWKMAGSMPDDWYKPFENLSAADIWFNFPGEGRLQIILFMGLFEIWSEARFVLENDGEKHYMRGGKPGYFPSFDLVPHPVPLKNLYDPFNFNGGKSDEWKSKKLVTEINNGRLAMIGLMSLLCEAKTPGSVPIFSSFGIDISPTSTGNALMAPFGPACAPVSQFGMFEFWGGSGACPVETMTQASW